MMEDKIGDYFEKKNNCVIVPAQFCEDIKVEYPPDNKILFERWVFNNYSGCKTDRVMLPINWTAFYVNNDYGNDKIALSELQRFIDSLDKTKKYFTVIQYDDGILNDVSGIDLLQFNMSKKVGIEIPLMCQPHPYKFNSEKKYYVSFVGSRTHPMRNGIEKYVNIADWYISYDQHSIENYCKILHQSIFVLCPRGYGINSFRIAEALQYGAIPIYISDEFIIPFGDDFEKYGILYKGEDISSLKTFLELLDPVEIVKKQLSIPLYYGKYFTYFGCLGNIIDSLETEYNSRK